MSQLSCEMLEIVLVGNLSFAIVPGMMRTKSWQKITKKPAQSLDNDRTYEGLVMGLIALILVPRWGLLLCLSGGKGWRLTA